MRAEDLLSTLKRIKLIGLPVYVSYDHGVTVEIERHKIVIREEGNCPGIYIHLENDSYVDEIIDTAEKAYRVL